MVVQVVKNLPAILETRVPSLGREGPLEEGMATHSSILAWRIPWTEEPVHHRSWQNKCCCFPQMGHYGVTGGQG